MDAGPLRDVLVAGVGLFTGALSGAFGVGGAVLSQPGLRALGVAPIIAVGTTLPSIIPSAVSGALRYRDEGLIDRNAVVLTVPVGLVCAGAGALLSDAVPGNGHLLMLMTAGLLALTAWRLYRGGRPPTDPIVPPPAPSGDDPPVRTRQQHRVAFGVVGAVAGLLSGLLGIGGGVVMVPGFHSLARMSVKASIATSLVCVGLFAVPGTIAHALQDHVDWRVAAFLTLTVVPGARIGAALTMRADEHRLRTAVAAFLGVIAVVYAAGELAALLDQG